MDRVLAFDSEVLNTRPISPGTIHPFFVVDLASSSQQV